MEGVTQCVLKDGWKCVQSSRNVLEGTQPRLRLDGMEENGKFWRLGIESDAT